MIELDAYTLSMVAWLVCFMSSLSMLLFYTFFQTYSGFRQISLSFLLFSIALIVNVLDRYWPGASSYTNVLTGLGLVCLYWGIHRFRRITIRFTRIAAAFIVVLAVISFVLSDEGHESVYKALSIAFVFMLAVGFCIWAILRSRLGNTMKYQSMAVAGFVVIEICIIGRIAGLLIDFETTPLHPANVLQLSMVYGVPVFMILLSSAFMWGCIEMTDKERESQANKVEESKRFLRVLLNSIPMPVFYKDTEGRYISVNNAFCDITALSEPELIGRTALDVFHQKSEAMNMSKETDKRVVRSMEPCSYETKLRFRDGLFHEVLVNKDAHINPAGEVAGIVGTITDITDRKIYEAKISYMALHDLLTTMPNRNLFFELSWKYLAAAKRSGSTVAMMYLDLDGFKEINDTYGHDAGDYTLKTISRRLLENVRQSDAVGRLGGDEFALVVNGMKAREDMAGFARKIIDLVSVPIDFQNQKFQIGVSVGIAFFPVDAEDLESLVKCADAAMYQSKKSGKNKYVFYDEL